MSDEQFGRGDPEIEAILRGLDADEMELLEPPPAVWEAIQSEVGESADASGAVVDLQSRRRRIRRIALAAAAVILVAAGVTSAVTLTRDDSPPVVATADLVHDPGSFDPMGAEASASANLVDHGDRHTVEIFNDSLPAPGADADLEVWLIQPDPDGGVSDLVSLGLVEFDDPGGLDVPADYDPDIYYVVDISVEPRDGDPTHSGRSILRGPLRDT